MGVLFIIQIYNHNLIYNLRKFIEALISSIQLKFDLFIQNKSSIKFIFVWIINYNLNLVLKIKNISWLEVKEFYFIFLFGGL